MRSRAIPSARGDADGLLAKQIDTTLAKVRGEYDQVLKTEVEKSSCLSTKRSKLMIVLPLPKEQTLGKRTWFPVLELNE